MAIDLLNSFLQRGQNVSSSQKNTTQKADQTFQNLPQNLQIMRAVRALQAGQTLRGEVISVKGDEVRLAIMNDLLIDAKLAQSMNLTPGTTMPFQVKSNTSQGLSLIPLFTNTAADPNVLKALDMAQIPVNERSLEMVQTLMEKGMPIDKQSIQEIYKDVAAFKDAAVRDIVSLHQMKISVNQDNLTQYSLYQNNEHYLKNAFFSMGSAIGEQLESLVAEGKTESAQNLVRDLQQLFQNNENGNVSVQGKAANIVSTEEMLSKDGKILMTEEKVLMTDETVPGSEQKADAVVKQSADKLISDAMEETQNSETTDAKKEAAASNRDFNSQAAWKELTDILLKERTPGKISEAFEKIWDKEISRQWMMEPEMVMEKKNVKEYYEKLESQIRQLEKVFEDSGMAKSPAAKAIQNTASNLDFMNQLNQMHAYIQLPLKMTNQNAHGELYVFTNKRNLSKQEGKVTALLHLDMEHLGKMDVYVALENKKVSTNFYLEKEEYIDFLEAHLDLLSDRLNKRGYSCDIKTTLRNEEESIIKTIEKQQNQPMLLSMQAFDVRA